MVKFKYTMASFSQLILVVAVVAFVMPTEDPENTCNKAIQRCETSALHNTSGVVDTENAKLCSYFQAYLSCLYDSEETCTAYPGTKTLLYEIILSFTSVLQQHTCSMLPTADPENTCKKAIQRCETSALHNTRRVVDTEKAKLCSYYQAYLSCLHDSKETCTADPETKTLLYEIILIFTSVLQQHTCSNAQDTCKNAIQRCLTDADHNTSGFFDTDKAKICSILQTYLPCLHASEGTCSAVPGDKTFFNEILQDAMAQFKQRDCSTLVPTTDAKDACKYALEKCVTDFAYNAKGVIETDKAKLCSVVQTLLSCVQGACSAAPGFNILLDLIVEMLRAGLQQRGCSACDIAIQRCTTEAKPNTTGVIEADKAKICSYFQTYLSCLHGSEGTCSAVPGGKTLFDKTLQDAMAQFKQLGCSSASLPTVSVLTSLLTLSAAYLLRQ